MSLVFRTRFPFVALTLILAPIVCFAQATEPPLPGVIVSPVTSDTLAYEQAFTGRVTAVQHIDLRARISGFVTAVDFEEGVEVDEGAVLFEVEPEAYEAAVTQVQGQIMSAEAEKKLADIELARQTELVAKDVAAETTAQQAEANVGNVLGKLQQLQGELQQAQLNLSYTKVIAPFAGRIGFTDIDVGAFVSPEIGVLASLSSIDPIYVTLPISESLLFEVHKRLEGQEEKDEVSAYLTLSNGARYEHAGVVAVVDTTVQTGTDTILLRVRFDNPEGLLRDGQLVTVALTEDSNDAVLTIPIKALQRDQAGYFVMTVDSDGVVSKAPIEVARISGMKVAIASGLEEGQAVITDGVQKVREGMKVNPSTSDQGDLSQTPAVSE